jgi:hypothetical protein
VRTLNDLAPHPTSLEETTADALARNLSVVAQAHWRRQVEGRTFEERFESVTLVVNLFGVVTLLRALIEHAPGQADAVARELRADWEGASGVGEDLWQWLTEYGIDPEQVNKIAADLPSRPTAQAAIDRRAWTIPKIPHDEHVAVTPYVMPDGTINRTKGNSTPAHARHYAAQLLAAADEADRLRDIREALRSGEFLTSRPSHEQGQPTCPTT